MFIRATTSLQRYAQLAHSATTCCLTSGCQYLLRGPTITLDGDNMPDVSKYTVATITRRNAVSDNLRELHLRNLGKIQDVTFAVVVEKLPALRVLDLGYA